jgi:hypothetical protein
MRRSKTCDLFVAAQIQAVKKINQGPRNSKGQKITAPAAAAEHVTEIRARLCVGWWLEDDRSAFRSSHYTSAPSATSQRREPARHCQGQPPRPVAENRVGFEPDRPRSSSTIGPASRLLQPREQSLAWRRRGLNNKIRVIQRRAYGLRDEEYLRLKVLTCTLPMLCQPLFLLEKHPTRIREEPIKLSAFEPLRYATVNSLEIFSRRSNRSRLHLSQLRTGLLIRRNINASPRACSIETIAPGDTGHCRRGTAAEPGPARHNRLRLAFRGG